MVYLFGYPVPMGGGKIQHPRPRPEERRVSCSLFSVSVCLSVREGNEWLSKAAYIGVNWSGLVLFCLVERQRSRGVLTERREGRKCIMGMDASTDINCFERSGYSKQHK